MWVPGHSFAPDFRSRGPSGSRLLPDAGAAPWVSGRPLPETPARAPALQPLGGHCPLRRQLQSGFLCGAWSGGTRRCDPRPAAPSPPGGCLAPSRPAPVGFGPPALFAVLWLPSDYRGLYGGVGIAVCAEGTAGSRGPVFCIPSERPRERALRCTPAGTGRASAPWCAA